MFASHELMLQNEGSSVNCARALANESLKLQFFGVIRRLKIKKVKGKAVSGTGREGP
jgi:hypothetical protein